MHAYFLQKIHVIPLEIQPIVPEQHFLVGLYASKVSQQYGKDIEIFQSDAFLYEAPESQKHTKITFIIAFIRRPAKPEEE